MTGHLMSFTLIVRKPLEELYTSIKTLQDLSTNSKKLQELYTNIESLEDLYYYGGP